MLVKELIEELKRFPENYSIIMESGMDTADVDLHQLDEFQEVVIVPLG